MIQREVLDKENIRWTCVQSFTMAEGEAAERLKESVMQDKEKVMVVCTPSGGQKTVRVELPNDWNQVLTDDELIKEIEDKS
jgi:hypothetical protein